MHMEILEYGIQIIPDTVQDKVYLKKVLGLEQKDSTAIARRQNVVGFSEISSVIINKIN